MRRAAIHAARTSALLVMLAALLVPAGAWAAADLPDEMVDPVGAMEPEIAVGEPAQPAQPAAQEQAPAEDAIPDVQAAGGPAAGANAAPTAIATPRPVSSGSGSLPFTGPQPGLLVLLVLVGFVAVLGGVTAFGYARAATEAA